MTPGFAPWRAGILCLGGAVGFLLAAPLAAQTAQEASGGEGAARPPAVDTSSIVLPDIPELDGDIGVDWPDLSVPVPQVQDGSPDEVTQSASQGPEAPVLVDVADEDILPDEPDAAQEVAGDPTPLTPPDEEEGASDDGTQYRYALAINGLDSGVLGDLRGRFDALSLLHEGRGQSANLAQINRRMRQDRMLWERLLRSRGYYDAQVRAGVRAGGPEHPGRITVVFDVVPGVRYLYDRVGIAGLADVRDHIPDIAASFPLGIGDPVDADRMNEARSGLTTRLIEGGYPFARIDEPTVDIDHDRRTGEVDIIVTPGGYRRFGAFRLDDASSRRLFGAGHVARIARFSAGDPYAASGVEDLRRAIVATGLVSNVDIRPVDAGDDTHVGLDIAMTPAPLRTIAGEVGFGTGEGYRAEISWQHRNMVPPEGAVTVRGLVGTKEQLVGLSYRGNNFGARDHVLNGGITIRKATYAAYSARTVTFAGALERQTTLYFQKQWTWSLGAELVASRERDLFGARLVRADRTYIIGALPTGLTYDGSDSVLDPARGFRLGGRISPELSVQGTTFGYARVQLDASAYAPVTTRLVLAGRIRAGSIFGAGIDRIAPSRRFYAGGGASVRGYAYQAIGPRDANNDPVGGKSLLEISTEARIRMGAFGLVPFFDAGNISTRFLPRLSDMRYGAGLGVRYYTSFGPVRVDVGTPLNRQSGDSRIAVYVSLGQAF